MNLVLSENELSYLFNLPPENPVYLINLKIWVIGLVVSNAINDGESCLTKPLPYPHPEYPHLPNIFPVPPHSLLPDNHLNILPPKTSFSSPCLCIFVLPWLWFLFIAYTWGNILCLSLPRLSLSTIPPHSLAELFLSFHFLQTFMGDLHE